MCESKTIIVLEYDTFSVRPTVPQRTNEALNCVPLNRPIVEPPNPSNSAHGPICFLLYAQCIMALSSVLDDCGTMSGSMIARSDLGLRGYEAYCGNWTAAVHLPAYLALIEEIASKEESRQ